MCPRVSNFLFMSIQENVMKGPINTLSAWDFLEQYLMNLYVQNAKGPHISLRAFINPPIPYSGPTCKRVYKSLDCPIFLGFKQPHACMWNTFQTGFVTVGSISSEAEIYFSRLPTWRFKNPSEQACVTYMCIEIPYSTSEPLRYKTFNMHQLNIYVWGCLNLLAGSQAYLIFVTSITYM